MKDKIEQFLENFPTVWIKTLSISSHDNVYKLELEFIDGIEINTFTEAFNEFIKFDNIVYSLNYISPRFI